jgi:hypothetical protein
MLGLSKEDCEKECRIGWASTMTALIGPITADLPSQNSKDVTDAGKWPITRAFSLQMLYSLVD